MVLRFDSPADHPEGGRFQEVFRSALKVQAADGRRRSALTHIYFSLRSGEVSHFHRVASDEVWNLYQGKGLRLILWEEAQPSPVVVELSAEGGEFCHVVPAGVWQAADPLGDAEVLVGCSVGPGFDFEDFSLLDPHGEPARRLLDADPAWRRFVPQE